MKEGFLNAVEILTFSCTSLSFDSNNLLIVLQPYLVL